MEQTSISITIKCVHKLYDRYQPSYQTCFGELKGEGSSDTLSIMDFYRLDMFAKLEIISSNVNGVLCFQALGTFITFYTMVHTNSSIYAFAELATITIPKAKNSIMLMTSILDDLYKIATYHRILVKSQIPNIKRSTLPFEFVQKKHYQQNESLFWDRFRPNKSVVFFLSFLTGTRFSPSITYTLFFTNDINIRHPLSPFVSSTLQFTLSIYLLISVFSHLRIQSRHSWIFSSLLRSMDRNRAFLRDRLQ
ncbi:hypothetical protein BCV71DRAFT_276663 [Rhizopus microsporus]|uniref:Uncharacterized protein n=1 Tax=Rhizopus microsporus TaxID=58291 RepID=A0A1X0RQ82_RHIZD|nr:hypothetical protein BCV71DRAFT_276663 [Rhizopus microsporus]